MAQVSTPCDGHEGIEERSVGRWHVGVQDHVVDRPYLSRHGQCRQEEGIIGRRGLNI